MKRVLLGVGFLFTVVIALIFAFHQDTSKKLVNVIRSAPTVTPIPKVLISQKILFIPYWTLDSVSQNYDTYAYFGISPTSQGAIDTTDDGYKDLSQFTNETQGKHTLLIVRMIDSDVNKAILQNNDLQQELIQEAITTAQTYQFDGIVLDLEYHALAFPDVTQSVTDFSTTFAKAVKAQNLSFYQMIVGDTFYLARPYDVKMLAAVSDGIFVMSYDFHKANGTPGPNFPLTKLPDADYDFSDMLSDFAQVVPRNKLTIVFGMFGYDWTVDGQGRPIKSGESLTTNQITSLFLHGCHFAHCNVQRDNAEEANITYIDAKNQRHIVWLEDAVSVAKKEVVVEQQGISRIGFWANGYF